MTYTFLANEIKFDILRNSKPESNADVSKPPDIPTLATSFSSKNCMKYSQYGYEYEITGDIPIVMKFFLVELSQIASTSPKSLWKKISRIENFTSIISKYLE